jgi:STE24 endopeptidase
MNLFLILFALFYIAEHGVAYWLTFLNLKHVRQHEDDVPSYFRDKISLEEYQKSIRYTRDKTRLAVVSSAVDIPVFWALLLSGFFGKADLWVRSFGYSSVVTGLIFFAAMSALFYVISLPFSLYSTFVIEQKYGFNKMTLKLWVIDLAKGLLLSVLIGVPVLSAVLWFMDHLGNGPWWFYVWAVLALVQLFVMAVFPALIVPIFNKLTPLEEGSLKERIQALAWKVKFKMSGIFTMDGSKRSTHSNAFFAGMGKFRRIVLFDTLVKSLSELELVAVLAHEMGHYKKKHLRTGLVVGLGSSLLGLYVLSLIIKAPWFYQAFGFMTASSYAALFIFMKASGSFTFFLEPLFSLLSRKHEYEADRFAAEAVGTPEPMIQGLVKLTKDNLSNLTPHPLYSFFYYSHPTVMERIAALEGVRAKG